MTVRAKFRCNNVEDGNEGKIITLDAVYDSNPESENGRFFHQTPWGQLKMGTVNEHAAQQFFVGQDYYIDFTLAE